MELEPWKLMIGLSVLIVLVGILVTVGATSPGEIVLVILLLGAFAVMVYFGYRIGKTIGASKSK